VKNLNFIEAIKKNDKMSLSKIPKVDIHNHAAYSCKISHLRDNNIEFTNMNINNIETLSEFCRSYINPIQYDRDGLKMLLEGDFKNCIETGVTVVAPSVDYKTCIRIFNSNVKEFITFLNQFSYNTLTILWDLGISRDSYKLEYKQLIIDLINTKYFKGIDLYTTENSIPNSEFIEFYEISNKLNIITKDHAGEQLGPDYIRECILDFNPKQIQHGIHIVEDESLMKLSKDKGIIFNVCPTSNVLLGYAKDYKTHPIKIMVEYGLNVTIGTDDILFFNSDINEEYLKLFNEGTLTPEQLDKIRKYGLEIINNNRC